MTHYSEKMNTLLQQMEHLQSEMTVIEDKQREKNERENEKETTMDPNLHVMSDFLEKTSILKEYYDLDKTEQHKHVLSPHCTGNAKCAPSKDTSLYQLQQPYHSIIDHRNKTKQILESLNNNAFMDSRVYNHPRTYDIPSKFMLEFVESTFNMFNQINARLQKIEYKLDPKL